MVRIRPNDEITLLLALSYPVELMPITPQARREPAFPVLVLPKSPPNPKSSVPSCSTTPRPKGRRICYYRVIDNVS